MFRLDEAGLFLDTMLHILTLLAVLFITKEFIYLIKNPFSKLMLLFIVGTIPQLLLVYCLKTSLKIFQNRNHDRLGVLVTGFFLYMADKQKNGRKMDDITYKDALIIGSFQAAAIFPAISFWNDNCRCIMEKN